LTGFLICPSCSALVQWLSLFEHRHAAHESMVGIQSIKVPVQFCSIERLSEKASTECERGNNIQEAHAKTSGYMMKIHITKVQWAVIT
jgi:hypothetical protein